MLVLEAPTEFCVHANRGMILRSFEMVVWQNDEKIGKHRAIH